jgi:hypothetical protein
VPTFSPLTAYDAAAPVRVKKVPVYAHSFLTCFLLPDGYEATRSSRLSGCKSANAHEMKNLKMSAASHLRTG